MTEQPSEATAPPAPGRHTAVELAVTGAVVFMVPRAGMVTFRRARRMSRTDSTRGDEQRWADLADLAAMIAREIRHRGAGDRRAVLLTRSECVVMRHLLRGDPATPSRIAAATGLLRPNVSAALRTLRSKGLIDKQADPADGRGVTIRPTPLGRARYELVRRERANAVARAAGHDTTDLDAAIGLLTKVREGLLNDRPVGPS